MENSPTLSAVIITKNEEKNIGRCLESLVSIADEIIVVDSFSTDKTGKICADYKATFIQLEWKGYAQTKNYANSRAHGKYILSLDADEALSENLIAQLKNFKSNPNKPDACQINRLTNFCGKWIHHCGWYPDKKIRLWKSGLASWEGLVHEKLILKPGAKVERIKADILHYSYYTINEYVDQMSIYTDLAAQENFERGKNYPKLKIVISPIAKFITSYIIRGGILDGFYGLVISVLSSTAAFLKYAKTRQLFNLQDKKS